MLVKTDYPSVFIDGIPVVHLYSSDGRPGSRNRGVVMWSYDAKPLGWVSDSDCVIEWVVAAQLFGGGLDPHWEEVPTGSRLIHPRYTLNAEKTHGGWLPKIEDGLTGRMHALRPCRTRGEATGLLDALLRRRVGRAKPRNGWRWWLGPAEKANSNHAFQLALLSMRAHIGALVAPVIENDGNF